MVTRAARALALHVLAFAAAAPLVAQPEADAGAAARAFLDAGDRAYRTLDYRGALTSYRAAGAEARRAGADPELGRALHGEGLARGALGEIKPSMELAADALRVFERIGDLSGQAEAWNAIGNGHYTLGEHADAHAKYEKAYELWKTAGDRRGAARATNNLGNLARMRGDYEEALARFGEALPIFEALGDLERAAVVTNNVAIVHFWRGEYPEALDYARRGLAVRDGLGNRSYVAASYDTLGNIYRALGAYARALDFFHRALKIREELGDKMGTLETWNNIGLVHFSHGDYRLAIDAYKRGLRLNRDLGGDTLVPEALYNVAAAAWRLGERVRAEANYRESLRLCERGGYRPLAASCLHDLGRMALEDGRLEAAQGLLERSLQTREAIQEQAGMAESLNSLAALSLARRQPAEALGQARRAAEIARRYEQPETQWEAETLAGLAHRALGQPERARASFEAAVAVIEGLRLQVVRRAEGRERFFERKLSPYHELMALAVARGAHAEALELAERSKARVLADIARSGRVDLAGALTEEERREESRLRGALVSVNRKLQAESARDAPDAAVVAALEAERQVRRSAYETLQAAIHARHPGRTARRGGGPAFTLGDAERMVPDASTAVLEYTVTEQAAYLFVLTREGERVRLGTHVLGGGRPALAPLARRYRERLAARDLGFAEDARGVYDRLLAPAAGQLRGRRRLIVVPDGPLWDVPFQALQDREGRYVVESAAVSYAPSLTVLREILAAHRPRTSPPTVLAMGKADFGAAGAAPEARLMSDLGPLPDAERQVRLIAALYGPGRSSAHLGPEAREDRFKAEAPRHAILHLATHGVLDETSPLYSHVVLSPGPSGSSEDGLLEAWEIAGLDLDADLAILAACETGRGRVAPGEGIVGTMWALFVAGARALVVSQWKVEATSTTDLMVALHRGLAAGGGDTAEHLRNASLQLLRNPQRAHPFYWAGFVVVGNPY